MLRRIRDLLGGTDDLRGKGLQGTATFSTRSTPRCATRALTDEEFAAAKRQLLGGQP